MAVPSLGGQRFTFQGKAHFKGNSLYIRVSRAEYKARTGHVLAARQWEPVIEKGGSVQCMRGGALVTWKRDTLHAAMEWASPEGWRVAVELVVGWFVWMGRLGEVHGDGEVHSRKEGDMGLCASPTLLAQRSPLWCVALVRIMNPHT